MSARTHTTPRSGDRGVASLAGGLGTDRVWLGSDGTAEVSVVRPVAGRLGVRHPVEVETREWLRDSGCRTWWPQGPGAAELTRTALASVVVAALVRFGPVELLLDGLARRACSAACQDAGGPACECSCLGRHHGDRDAWRVRFGVPRPEVEVVGWAEPGRVLRGRVRLCALDSASALLGRSVLDEVDMRARRRELRERRVRVTA